MSRSGIASILLAVMTTGCVVGELPADPTPPDAEPPPARRLGIVTSPRHGDVVPGDTGTATLQVTGFHEAPDYRIDVQVLDDPRVATSWTTIGTTVSATTASDNGLYAWTLLVAPTREAPQRWPAGGVLRIRAIGESAEALPVLFHDEGDCLTAVPDDPWPAILARCGAPVTNGLILVSPSPTPAEVAVRAPFLDRRDTVDVAETLEYYATIDAPPTLAEFRARFGFDATSAPASFYNASDLGIGRELHCRAQSGGGLACYSSNYGEFGGDREAALAAAIQGVEAGGSVGAFATVAMVYQPPISAPNSVRFVVYDAAGALATQAQLDTFGDNISVPNNCLNCHGGARYDAAQNAVIGARFLPFDATGFAFAPQLPRFRAVDQLPRLHALNQLIATTEPSPAIRELIDGFASTPAQPAVDFVAAGWNGSALERKVYTEVVAVACRSCHASLSGSLDFRSATAFQDFRGAIADSICGPSGNLASHDMPSAEVPLRRLWTTPARAYLVDYLDIAGACEP